MAKIPDGCILVARQIFNSEIWHKKPAWWLKVWIYILGKVNHADNRFFKRGENLFTYKQIYDDCNLVTEENDTKSIDNLVRWLKTATQITTRKTTRGFIITICNYNHFQNINNYRNDTENDTGNETETKQKRNRNDTINKNVNNNKNTPIEQSPKETTKTGIQQVVEHFKVLKGYDKQEDWDKIHFSRHVKPAGELLKANADNIEQSKSVMSWLNKEYGAKCLEWTLETCIKKTPDYRKSLQRSSQW